MAAAAAALVVLLRITGLVQQIPIPVSEAQGFMVSEAEALAEADPEAEDRTVAVKAPQVQQTAAAAAAAGPTTLLALPAVPATAS